MKNIAVNMAAVFLGLLFLTGCFGVGTLQISYLAPMEKELSTPPVYVQIKDTRADRSILSPKVVKMNLFTGGVLVSLDTKTADGRATALSNVDIEKAFYEALRVRFQSMNLGLLPQPEPNGLSLEIDVERVWLDEGDRKFRAEIAYVVRYKRAGKEFRQERIMGESRKLYVRATPTAQETISEAFTSAVNNLDLTPFK